MNFYTHIQKIILLFCLVVSIPSFSQRKEPANWQTLDPKSDHVYGTGIEKAYETLAGKPSQTIIVAVIDGGIDIDHEDLKDIIWTNPGEIPDNGIDDDKNGYIDDVHGWNFLGGKNGDIELETTELARLYYKLNKKFKNVDTTSLTGEDAEQFNQYVKIRGEFLTTKEEQESQLLVVDLISDLISRIKKENNGELNRRILKKYKPADEFEKQVLTQLKPAFLLGLTEKELSEQLQMSRDEYSHLVAYDKLNADSLRRYIVGDDPDDPNERYYGNNHVAAASALHGSHVAGIIAAIRNNNIGINGIASNVRIMVVRAVPDGDERDKDIANAIRYAVDNGAKVINMSFGKYYSPDKKVVDEAVQYALSKDVLLIHAAGNEAKNMSLETVYPNREFLSGGIASNWIEVGASGYHSGKKIIADFSNYGKTKVDLFAPGVNVYSTVAGNKYQSFSGTSMASPSTAGVAAALRSFYPELKANEVRDVLMKTVVPYRKKVNVPGAYKEGLLRKKHVRKKVSELCISGGFVNANNAVKELTKK